MKKDFRPRSSAADGAAPKRVYKAKGFTPRENSSRFEPANGDPKRRERRNPNGSSFQKRRDGEGQPRSRSGYGSPDRTGARPSFRKDRFDKAERINRGERTVRFNRSYNERPQQPKAKPAPQNTEEVRLNKFIANSGICSRREADEYIQAGLVTVNGTVVTTLGTKVNINDDVRFNGERLKGERKVYIVMNKPKDYVTTMSDPHADKTVMDLLSGCKERVFPVGRLDKSTTGVLMFTNDGRLTEMLTHPSYNKKKIYQVTLDKKLSSIDFEKILKGIWLPDGEIAADELAYVEGDKTVIGIKIHSGRNRIVRRIFESLGYEVKKLDRVYFAGLTKKNLRRGEWRYLNEKEVNMLMMGSYE